MPLSQKTTDIILISVRATIIVLSALLILFISYDTFKGIAFLDNSVYMTFQLAVCVVFIICFFIELWLAADRRAFVHRNWLFLLLSVPYLNIINAFNLSLDPTEIYWVRFIPLARGALAMAIVAGYVSTNRVSSVFVSYIVVMLSAVYFGSLIFMNHEYGVNPDVKSYWDSLWWAYMDSTTAGCPIVPVTVPGKIIGFVLSAMGMMMFGLFTNCVVVAVQRYTASRRPQARQ